MEMRVARLDKKYNQEDEGLGELDKREFLRDTSILIMLAEKGLKTEQDIVKPVLDKIRAEIEQLRLHKAQFLTNDNKVCVDSQEVLNILDKYKTESEG